MKQTLLLVALCAAAALAQYNRDKFYFEAVLYLPIGGISEPVRVNQDASLGYQRVDYYNATDYDLYTSKLYSVYVAQDHQECAASPRTADFSIYPMLPDLSQMQKVDDVVIEGVTCEHYSVVDVEGGKTNTYDFYVNKKTQAPYRFSLHGYDYIWGSHYDLYVLDYTSYTPGYTQPNVFDTPAVCKSSATVKHRPARITQGTMRTSMLSPPSRLTTRSGNSDFAAFQATYAKTYATQAELVKRQRIFEKNVEYIRKFNMQQPMPTYRLAINHLADWTYEEFKQAFTSSGRRQQLQRVEAPVKFYRTDATLPDSIDWRLRGAVTDVKDQGVCGSCWTFSTIATVEGALFKKTGNLTRFSEQSILDCSWNTGSEGCNGGFTGRALWNIVKQNGGYVDLESQYPYMMADGYCKHNQATSGATPIKSWGEVLPAGDEQALQEAIATVGPIAIAISVPDSMMFYASGVYNDPACTNDRNMLDHDVTAVGYDSDNGLDYYIVKNSWSPFWGSDGYIFIARNDNNLCGVASTANYAIA
eukprot:TRINITY_DN124_c0_g1_i2.p1 TRINITY_DN124_c0_g1~~TRINITY_DN124_c0_g1_i2.p1  ORF type:complete len:531 (+),score=161.54 TRINITY_DN124_c0_g1_i2:103-1695(+)